jgi:hypothetical protein
MENKNTFLFAEAFNILKKTWADLILILFLVICVILGFFIILSGIYYLIFSTGLISLNNLYTFRLFWTLFTYILTFLIAVIAQILLITHLIKPGIDFKKNLIEVKENFVSFLGLSIILNILFFLFTLPIYVAVFLFIYNNLILGVISLGLGFALTLSLTAYMIAAPFLIIDKNMKWLEAIKQSFQLTHNKIGNIIINIIILAITVVILNSLSILIVVIPGAGIVLATIISIFLIIFAFSYIYAIYQKVKSNES